MSMPATTTPATTTTATTTTPTKRSPVFIVIGGVVLLIVLAIVMFGDGCGGGNSNADKNNTSAPIIYQEPPRPEMQMTTRWFSDFPNDRMMTYLSQDYGNWRSHPRLRSGEEGIPVAVLEWEGGKIIDIAGRNISSNLVPPNNQCSIWRPARTGEYDPAKGEVPAQGLELDCYTCSTEYCP